MCVYIYICKYINLGEKLTGGKKTNAKLLIEKQELLYSPSTD